MDAVHLHLRLGADGMVVSGASASNEQLHAHEPIDPIRLRAVLRRADFGFRGPESTAATDPPLTREDLALAEFDVAIGLGALLDAARAHAGIDGSQTVRWCLADDGHDVPIEFARYSGDEPPVVFAPDESVVRWVDSRAPRALAVDGPLRILQVLADAAGYDELPLDRAEAWFEDGIGGAPDVVVQRASTWTELCDRLATFRPHALDVNTHGEQGRILIGDRAVPAAELAAVVARSDSVRLALCAACHSCDSPSDGGADPSVVRALVESGVPAAVGWFGRAENLHESHFAREFWREVVRGATLDEAMLAGRSAMRDFALLDQWATVALTTSTHELVLRPALRPSWLADRSGEVDRQRGEAVRIIQDVDEIDELRIEQSGVVQRVRRIGKATL